MEVTPRASDNPIQCVRQGAAKGLPSHSRGWAGRTGARALPPLPWTLVPACPSSPSRHLETSEPDCESHLSGHREEGHELFGAEQPEDPEKGEATQRLPALSSSHPSAEPRAAECAPDP